MEKQKLTVEEIMKQLARGEVTSVEVDEFIEKKYNLKTKITHEI